MRRGNEDEAEAEVQAQCILLAPKLGCRLWRNNSGACYDQTGRLIRYGLGNISKRFNEVWKSGDLVGIRERDGKLLMFECKPPWWTGRTLNAREKAQANALQDVANCNGISAFVTDAEQLRELVK